MKSSTMTFITLFLVALLPGACVPLPAPSMPSPETLLTAPVTPSGQASLMSEVPSAVTVVPATTVAPAATAAAKVPLKDAVASMEPQDVWQNFYDLTQIPRPSHHEEQVRDFLAQFGKGLGLETIVDTVGNVLIRKPAAQGMENREGVILQAHMDMVAQSAPGVVYDPLTDPINAYVEGDWVAADGTTLGADDGIGVAIAMAVLESQTPPLGPIEALFTVNEEDGMDGGLGLQPGLLQGTILINMDWEAEGTFLISSAGGEYAHIVAPYVEMSTPGGMQAYQVTVSGLTGGHSGTEINLGRGHAAKLLVRLLSTAAPEYGLGLANITGGTAANAIPQEATALVTVPTAQADAFLEYVGEYQQIVRAELEATEPTLAVGATATDMPPAVMAEDAQRIIDALYGTPQGVLRMSDVVPDLVETSNNMGIVQGADGELDVTCYPRSSVDTELDDVAQMISSVWDLAGIEVTFDGRYPGWKANPDSPILGLMKNVYHDLYGVDPETVSVHAGTECGVIQAAYPGMDAISIGPTIQNEHTPEERLEVASVKKLANLVTETLVRMPEAVGQPTPVVASQAEVQPTGTPTAPAPKPVSPTPPSATLEATPTQTWAVATLLATPGKPGRLYALVTDGNGPLWASPATGVRLMISDDFADTWTPFPGGLPVSPECMVNVGLDYFTPDALYASTCQGLYVWEGTSWARRSDTLTDVVAVVYGQPDQVWAGAHGDGVIRSDDGGRTWRDASAGLTTFGGMANLGIDPRDPNILYGIIQPKYAGSYLRRGTSEGNWETMPTPKDNATIETGMVIDGGSGALYLTTQLPPVELWRSPNPSTANFADVKWELVQTFRPEARIVLLASGWGPQGMALYASIWPNWFDQNGASTANAVLGRSLDGGHTWEDLPMP